MFLYEYRSNFFFPCLSVVSPFERKSDKMDDTTAEQIDDFRENLTLGIVSSLGINMFKYLSIFYSNII